MAMLVPVPKADNMARLVPVPKADKSKHKKETLTQKGRVSFIKTMHNFYFSLRL